MKYLIALILMVFAFGVQAQRYDYYAAGLDTLTNTDTVTYTWSSKIWDHGVIEYHVAIDSISGTPAGTIYYEYALDPAGEEWYAVSTDTIANAAETSAEHKVTNFAGLRARIRVLSSGTQVVEVNPAISFKRY